MIPAAHQEKMAGTGALVPLCRLWKMRSRPGYCAPCNATHLKDHTRDGCVTQWWFYLEPEDEEQKSWLLRSATDSNRGSVVTRLYQEKIGEEYVLVGTFGLGWVIAAVNPLPEGSKAPPITLYMSMLPPGEIK